MHNQFQTKFHHIQKSIILSLANKSPAKFTELQPPRLPNNTFSYHLKTLIDRGYVENTAKGYIATRKALKLVVYGSETGSSSSTPTLISMICVTNEKNEILLINRKNKPFQGWYGMPSGLIHAGETLQQAAKREMFEKTTIISDEDLETVGVLDYRYAENGTGDIFMHVIAFVYRYQYTGSREELSDKETKYGQLSWSTLARNLILPEVFAVKDMLGQDTFINSSVTLIEPAQMATFTSTE